MDLFNFLTHFEILLVLFLVFTAFALAVNGIALHKRLGDEKRNWDYGFGEMQRRERRSTENELTVPATLEMTMPAALYTGRSAKSR